MSVSVSPVSGAVGAVWAGEAEGCAVGGGAVVACGMIVLLVRDAGAMRPACGRQRMPAVRAGAAVSKGGRKAGCTWSVERLRLGREDVSALRAWQPIVIVDVGKTDSCRL